MSSGVMSLKAKIRNHAEKLKVPAQAVLQNYMFERFLERLSLSKYRDKVIIKGGLLVTSLVGISTRTTMDMDVTVRSLPLDESHIREMIEGIFAVPVTDDISFSLTSIVPIRQDDEYGGFRVSVQAAYDTIIVSLFLDITTGDVITPGAIRHSFKSFFAMEKRFDLWAYNTETLLAEKVETILRRGIFNTRPRDFYDVYILTRMVDFNPEVFRKAYEHTKHHRNTKIQDVEIPSIMAAIEVSPELKSHWAKYQREYPFAKEVRYETVIQSIKSLFGL
jgi:predicted nucleotidyltransferase component of viral defense system